MGELTTDDPQETSNRLSKFHRVRLCALRYEVKRVTAQIHR